MPHDDPGQRDFDKSAADWDRNEARVRMTNARADALIARLTLAKNLVVMDYGAGTGLVTLRLQPHVACIVAADTSPGMLAVLGEKIAKAGIRNVDPRLWNVESDPMPLERFDVIVSTMTFHHLREIPPVLKRFHGLLTPGGRIGIADLDCEAGDFHADPAGVWHFGFDRPRLKKEFEEAGFRSVRVDTAYRLQRTGAGGVLKEFGFFVLTASK